MLEPRVNFLYSRTVPVCETVLNCTTEGLTAEFSEFSVPAPPLQSRDCAWEIKPLGPAAVGRRHSRTALTLCSESEFQQSRDCFPCGISWSWGHQDWLSDQGKLKFKMRTMSPSWRSYIAIVKAEKRNGVLSPLVEKETTKEELFVSKSPGDSR